MTQGLLIRLLSCIFVIGGFLYLYIDRQNDLTELKMEIPKLALRLRTFEEENAQLKFVIEQHETPQHLLKLLRKAEYSHLKQPLVSDVVIVHAD